MHPLHQAVFRRDLESLKTHLAADPPGVDVRDSDGRTALMHAAIEGFSEVIGILITSGADVNLVDSRGFTALHFAAQEFNLDAARTLLESAALVDAKDDFGNTPLARAVFASKGRGEMIQLLLANGADRSLRNNHDVSPKDLAERIANYDVARLL